MEQGKNQEKEKYPEFPVLVVDDDKNFLNSIEYILSSRGITNVECCQDSREVIPLLEKRKYSCILLDLKMEGITGEELLKKIAADYPEIPVIILTGINMVDIAVNCMRRGAVDYIVKPFDTDKLIETIRNAPGKIKHPGQAEEKIGESDGIKIKSIPYIYGCYIKDSATFYGRTEELDHIIQKISEAENGKFWHISVIGDYRIGKSSLLKKAEYEIEQKTQSISVYVDLSMINQEYFTSSIISKIIDNLDKKLGENYFIKIKNILKNNAQNHIDLDVSIIGLLKIKFNPKEGNHWEQFFAALNSLIKKAKCKKDYKSIVLILDEVNAITQWSDFRDVLMKLRAFAQGANGINLLVGSAYPLYQLTENEWSPFFNIFTRVNLRGITNDEADDLIESPAKEVGINYSKDSLNLIKEFCGNKPYYIQVICTKIFEKLRKQKIIKNAIEDYDVYSAVEDALEELNSHFTQIIHNKCTDFQKEFLLSIATRNNEETQKMLSDKSKSSERNLLIERGLIYKRGKEYILDGLLKEWLLREWN
jgi:CheY-like chemotaxis protein